MPVATSGVRDRRIHQCPIAVIDFETTGLNPGIDRVVEISVVRVEPGQEPRLAFDTLVNPRRPMAASEIHGIADADVEDAPRFEDIVGDFVDAISDCVVTAYNVYFDLRFLNYELSLAGVDHVPPHFCLMYMRPLLGLGTKCKLDEACQAHGIDFEASHIAAVDAEASSQLLNYYWQVASEQGISTFSDLASLRKYKFWSSLGNDPFPGSDVYSLKKGMQYKSRRGLSTTAPVTTVDSGRKAVASYWDALKTAIADLRITEEELVHIQQLRGRLGLQSEQIRVLHARAFASAIIQFSEDQWLDDREAMKLQRLHACLAKLGWAPGD